jgi:hypothetical protein
VPTDREITTTVQTVAEFNLVAPILRRATITPGASVICAGKD